ncbi:MULTISPECIES: glycosyltransferase [Chryseobacterium]|uniref:Putative glycosyl transferase n=1 Tax=Chryseobacterium taihuense TaxID=1141221 RepID=A0A4U8W9T8_9FLAO|nr:MULTISPECIES: glycosyltransferase [Chryseobacterium]QQV03727.1 glycosyltransferase [Chryseobacterium sp. FDAARGOS 1104]VFB02932.1 putative glycosyl transferase [Chryseobacterium taihuense]
MDSFKRKPVSVCMAVFNGELFLKQQIDSILFQLDHELDELIIVNDFSTDNSRKIIDDYHNPKIKIFENNVNLGYKNSFQKAIEYAENHVIFLSDQDDIWIEGRLMKIYNTLNDSGKLLVCSNFKTFSERDNHRERFKTKLTQYDNKVSHTRNILRIFKGDIAYFGCTMAFKSEMKKYILPFPHYFHAHDLWIAMVGNVKRSIFHLEDVTLLHRIHNNNTSFVKNKLYKKMFRRFLFIKGWMEAIRRNIFVNL